MTHPSRGCFFVYAFKFAWGHWCIIKFPHWDKQVIFKRKECGRFRAKDAAFLMSYFFPSPLLVSAFLWDCRIRVMFLLGSLITRGRFLPCKWMWLLLSLCLPVEEAVIGCSLSCPDRLSLHVKFCVPSATLAAKLLQSVTVCKPFWGIGMWNDWNAWPT